MKSKIYDLAEKLRKMIAKGPCSDAETLDALEIVFEGLRKHDFQDVHGDIYDRLVQLLEKELEFWKDVRDLAYSNF